MFLRIVSGCAVGVGYGYHGRLVAGFLPASLPCDPAVGGAAYATHATNPHHNVISKEESVSLRGDCSWSWVLIDLRDCSFN